jgi:ThiF family
LAPFGWAVWLSPAEQERYSRGVTLLRRLDRSPRRSAWEMQERLREVRILLIGLGGTGGYCAQALVASGVGHLHCVDHDTADLSNLNRQPLSRERDIGRPKLDAALEDLRALNHHPEVTGDRRRVAGPEDLAMLLDSGPGLVRPACHVRRPAARDSIGYSLSGGFGSSQPGDGGHRVAHSGCTLPVHGSDAVGGRPVALAGQDRRSRAPGDLRRGPGWRGRSRAARLCAGPARGELSPNESHAGPGGETARGRR